MKSITSYLIVSIALTLVGCAKSGDSSAPGAAPTATAQQASEFKMPQVKYPAAVVFEGGDGEPNVSGDNSKLNRRWRVYLCLEKTTSSATRFLSFDFTKLGFGPVLTISIPNKDGSPGATLLKREYNFISIKYTYETTLSDKPETNFGYAFGGTSFESSLIGDVSEVLESAPGFKDDDHAQRNRVSMFDLRTMKGTLMSGGYSLYESRGIKRYISNWLERFTFDQNGRSVNVIEVCEKANQPVVWQYGDQIQK